METLKNVFKSKDLRMRLLYLLFALIVIRVLSQITVPGVNSEFFASYFAGTENDALGFLNAFTGGGFERFSILALSITPYITASIITQLLTIAFPKMEELAREGEEGRKKLNNITKYLAIGLSLFESLAMCIGFGNQLLIEKNALNMISVTVLLTAGSCFLIWFADRITEHGIGNGVSFILLVNILSRVPTDLYTLYENFIKGKTIAKGGVACVIIAAVILVVVVLTLILNGAERHIPVQYSQKTTGRRLVGQQGSIIPLKVNTSGVIPVIFASSIMSFPGIILAFLRKSPGGFWGTVLNALNSSSWFNKSNWWLTLGAVLYALLVIAFAYFYTEITFNPIQVADNLKRAGGMIPGIRPGKPTENYLRRVLKYLVFIGAVGLIIVCVIPSIFNGLFNARVTFGGTSLIIIVSVILETMKQIDSMLAVRNYRGFLSGKRGA